MADALEQLPMSLGYFRLMLRCFGDTPERRAAILAGAGVRFGAGPADLPHVIETHLPPRPTAVRILGLAHGANRIKGLTADMPLASLREDAPNRTVVSVQKYELQVGARSPTPPVWLRPA